MPKISCKNTVAILSAVFFFLLSLGGCKDPIIKDRSLVNGPDDLLNLDFVDTFTVWTKTINEDPYPSDISSYGVLGSMNDPIFGKTVCGFYAQCRLTQSGLLFGANPLVDSVVFSIVSEDKYGKADVPVNFAVYELAEGLGSGITNGIYKTNESFGVFGTPLGVAFNAIFNIKDSVNVLGTNRPPQLRIRLNNSFGQKILASDSATRSSNENFLNFFKGVYVAAQGPIGNGIVYPILTASRISIYYHNDANDSLVLDLQISGSSVKVNHYDHVYTPRIQLAKLSTAVSDSIVYLQSGAGSKAKISFPYLTNLPKNIAINKAELIVTKWGDDVTGSDSLYPPPSVISLQKINSVGLTERFSDFDRNGLAASKVKNENGVNVTSYTFNVTQHLQQIISGAYPNNGFNISVSSAANAERLVLSNYPSDNKYKVKLRITFTKIS
jgi:hypothetical protein